MLEDKITQDFKQAMKDRQPLRQSVLSFLRSQIKNVAIEKKKDKLDDQEVLAVIRKQVKQRLDALEQFQKALRSDLVEKEKKEVDILRAYLPAEIPSEELNRIVAEVISNLGASSLKDMGRVMKEIMPKVSGRVDNKILSDIVRTKLTKNESGNPESK